MKKLTLILFAALIFSTSCFAGTYVQILGVGDSIMIGGTVDAALNGPLPTLSSYLGNISYFNGGIGGRTMALVLTDIGPYLITYTPKRVYCNDAINDIIQSVSLSTWLSGYATLLSQVSAAGAVLYPMQVTPYCRKNVPSDPYNYISGTEKTWNAALEDFAYVNILPMTATFLEMTGGYLGENCINTNYSDNIDSSYLHPNATGDAVMGYLMSKAAVPTRSRDYGNPLFPAFGHNSWTRGLFSGTASIVGGTVDSVTGGVNGGVLTLNNGDSWGSPVEAIVANSSNVSVTLITAQGNPVISYRVSTSDYYMNDNTVAWIPYTGAFSLTAGTTYFIQAQVANLTATQVQLSRLKIDWSGAGTPANASITAGVTIN